jgi:hypothetical protein
MTAALGERVGTGRNAEVFRYAESDVIKLLRDVGPAAGLEREAASQRAAAEAGVRAPIVRGIEVLDGRPGLVMSELQGSDCLTAVESRPWRVWAIGRGVGRLHRELAAVKAPAELPRLVDILRHAFESPKVPEAARSRLLAILGTLPEGDALCHFDFHPGNVIEAPGGDAVIDFASACAGDPIADHAKSLVILGSGTLPPGASRKELALVAIGRKLMLAAYRSGYRAGGSVDERLVRRWMPLVVGQRLAEGIEEERVPLLRLLSRSLKEAEEAD